MAIYDAQLIHRDDSGQAKCTEGCAGDGAFVAAWMRSMADQLDAESVIQQQKTLPAADDEQ